MTRPPSKSSSVRKSRPSASTSGIKPSANLRLEALICVLLAALILIAYFHVLGCQFITSYDDQEYVTRNQFISRGLSAESLTWAFTTFRCGNWHPLTWISHMLDYQLYGLAPRGHHVTNLLFHIANALTLFLLLSRMTGSVWRSGFVAALFAVHPLHVESVAWVSERKDLLSTFFWLLTLYAYLLYTKRQTLIRYSAIVIAFALGLMSKPMLVSLPIVLLILDFWPLNRSLLKWRLLWEKVPLFVMSAASCVVTIAAQRAGDAVVTLADVPLLYRIGNAAISYVEYVFLMLWPRNLAVCYPHRGANLPVMEAVGALFLLIAASSMALRYARRLPYLAAGWLWYLITLLPTIGLVQVGQQAMADRYSYIPLTGLFIIIAWGIPDLLSRGRRATQGVPVAAAVIILTLSVCTYSQVAVWRDSYSLFTHAIEVTRDNHLAYNLRGVWLDEQGKSEEAIADFTKSIELQPDYPPAHGGLGLSLLKTGNMEQGVAELETAVRLGLETPDVYRNLALAHLTQGQLDLAAAECAKSLQLDPSSAGSHNVMGVILGRQGKYAAAISELKQAAELDPASAEAHGNLATTYFMMGDLAASWREVHVFETMGGQPDPRFIADLSRRMPDPGP